MNESGTPILRSLRLHPATQASSASAPPPLLVVLHDDLDLAPLSLRLRSPPSSFSPRGHNGLRSLVALSRSFSSPPLSYDLRSDLYALGIGIGRDRGAESKDPKKVSDWVLGPLMKDDLDACGWEAHGRKGEVVEGIWNHLQELIARQARPS